ncbi:MAG: endonuclease VIII, partial [Anaerolineales bacterium]|nr:endonuclease VIII [Anaerolineales bacterium]
MPEGPEIRRAADALSAALAGEVATEVSFAFERLQPFAAALGGERITAVTSRSKAILTRFANDLTIYSHNQLYGQWFVRSAYDFPDTNRQLRLAIHTADASALLYSASEIEVLTPPELAAHPYLSRLGPELLDADVTAAQVRARFTADAFRRRSLAALLLDQG